MPWGCSIGDNRQKGQYDRNRQTKAIVFTVCLLACDGMSLLSAMFLAESVCPCPTIANGFEDRGFRER